MLKAASRGALPLPALTAMLQTCMWRCPQLPVCAGDLLGVEQALANADAEGGVHCMDCMRVRACVTVATAVLPN